MRKGIDNPDTPRARWRRIWRTIRVARRENGKAMRDVLIYGTGAVLVPKDGSDPRHIPLDELQLVRNCP